MFDFLFDSKVDGVNNHARFGLLNRLTTVKCSMVDKPYDFRLIHSHY